VDVAWASELLVIDALADSELLMSEDAAVEVIAAAELLRALDELPPAAFPDLVVLTEDNWPEM
jgi:hypothetical protein